MQILKSQKMIFFNTVQTTHCLLCALVSFLCAHDRKNDHLSWLLGFHKEKSEHLWLDYTFPDANINICA